VLRRQHKALSTESNYIYWLRHYVSALEGMPESLPSEQKLERFLTDLARHRGLSASSQNQALNAVLFFYREVLRQPLQGIDALRATRPVHLRHAPTIEETQALLRTVRDAAGYPTNLITRLLYGCGLRVVEPLSLRIKDVNLKRFSLVIRGAKGGKDRVVSLPRSLEPELLRQIEFARAVWHRDKQNGIPLMLPAGLARKYPDYQFSWLWAWLFPAHHTCFHPYTRAEVRFRMHEANVQRAIRDARRKLGDYGGGTCRDCGAGTERGAAGFLRTAVAYRRIANGRGVSGVRSDETWLSEWSGNLGGVQRWRRLVAWGVFGASQSFGLRRQASWLKVWRRDGCNFSATERAHKRNGGQVDVECRRPGFLTFRSPTRIWLLRHPR